FGIADGAHGSGLQILLTAYKIQDLAGRRIEHHAIDGEIAALHVFPRIFAEADLVGVTAIGVADIRTEGRDFDCLAVTGEGARRSTGFCKRYEHHSELLPDREGLWKDLHYLLR